MRYYGISMLLNHDYFRPHKKWVYCDRTPPNVATKKKKKNRNLFNKSDVKCQNTLSCLDQYVAPNSKYIGVESTPLHKWRWLRPSKACECPQPLKLSSERIGVSQRWSLCLLCWTNWTLIFDSDIRVKVNQFVRKIAFQLKYQQDRIWFKNLIGQGQSSPKLTGIITVLQCIFGPNLEILPSNLQ